MALFLGVVSVVILFLVFGLVDLSIYAVRLKRTLIERTNALIEARTRIRYLEEQRKVAPLTPEENERMRNLGAKGMLTARCPNGHSWLSNDPHQIVRRCTVCHAIKPWADPTLAGQAI